MAAGAAVVAGGRGDRVARRGSVASSSAAIADRSEWFGIPVDGGCGGAGGVPGLCGVDSAASSRVWAPAGMGARPRPTPTPLPHNGCFGFCRGQLRRVRLRDRPAPRWALTACEAGTQNVAVATGSGSGGRLLSPVSTASNLPGHGRHHLAIQCSSLLCVQLPPARSCLPPPPAALPNRHLQPRHPPPPAAPMHPPTHPRCHPSAVALDVPRDHVAGLVERSGRHDDKKTRTGTASPPLIPLPPKGITQEGAACRRLVTCRRGYCKYAACARRYTCLLGGLAAAHLRSAPQPQLHLQTHRSPAADAPLCAPVLSAFSSLPQASGLADRLCGSP